MRVLIDILHPAHVHFFRNSIQLLEAEGVELLVTSRDKDLTLQLLDAYQIKHTPLSAIGRSKAQLAGELVRRNARLLRVVQEFNPDVLSGVMGVSVAPVGRLTGTPSVVFYGTENARLSNKWVYRMSSEFVTPEAFRRNLGTKHTKYGLTQELAYLHPSYFEIDDGALTRAGLGHADRYSVVRFVSWGASHDVGRRGLSADDKIEVCRRLGEHGPVLVSAESELPREIEDLRIEIDVVDMHSLLARATVLFGESATMAAEAAVLGTPAVYVDDVGRGFTDQLEQEFGLVRSVPESSVRAGEALDWACQILADPARDGRFKSQRDRLLGQAPDLPRLINEKLWRWASTKIGS